MKLAEHSKTWQANVVEVKRSDLRSEGQAQLRNNKRRRKERIEKIRKTSGSHKKNKKFKRQDVNKERLEEIGKQ